MKRICRGESGVSIIEILIAVSVLVVGLLGMTGFLGSSIMMNLKSSDASVATNFALQRLEEVRNTPFDQIVDKGAGMTAEDTAATAALNALGLPPTDMSTSPATPATWNREVEDVEAFAGRTSLKSVVVTVTWGAGEQQREARLTTFIARTGLNKTVPRTPLGP